MKEESSVITHHPMKRGAAIVLWDVITCPLPTEVAQCYSMIRNLRSAVAAHSPGGTGGFTIFAIGADPPRPILNILFRSMMLICSIPQVHVRKMIDEMRNFAKSHPAPANFVVISGDKALSSTLNMLHGRNYNILVAHPAGHPHLAETASCVWDFPGILQGEPPYLIRKEMVPRIFTIPQPKVGTFVLWDVRSCPLPADESTCLDMLDNIYSAVYANCSSCTQTTMVAVGLVEESTPSSIISILHFDMLLVFTNLETHVRKMICSMEHWAKSNPVPANFLVISGDAALSSALKNLQSRKYNILVAHPDEHSADVVATASRVWHFKSLVSGKAPYLVRPEPRSVEKELSELPIAARVRSKKKKKIEGPEIAKGPLELEMNSELRQREIY